MVTAEEDSARRAANRERVLSGETVIIFVVQCVGVSKALPMPFCTTVI